MIKNSIIAEIGSTHDGNLSLAKKSITTAAKCGAKIVKFQMHISEEETLKNTRTIRLRQIRKIEILGP